MKELLLDTAFAGIPLCGAAAANSVWANWALPPAILVLGLGLGSLYFLLTGGRLQKGAGVYFTGLGLLLLVQSSPLHFLALYYLFSAHMVGHVIILLLCAPMLVLGLPHELTGKAARATAALSRLMRQRPWLGWLCGIGAMWFWHIPAVFDAASGTGSVAGAMHGLQTSSLLVAGALFVWPILGPVWSSRINPLAGVVYLFTACVGCSLLGLLITFAPMGIYHHYSGVDVYGFANTIREGWEITKEVDQQMAGLIMWVPCCFLYLSGSMFLLYRWFNAKEEQPAWGGHAYSAEGGQA